MRAASSLLALACLLAAALVDAPEGAHAQPAAAEGQRPECVAVRAEARMQAYGFDHVVTVTNGCEAQVTCRVSSDVNPAPSTQRLDPRARVEVVLWRGSPARTFVPRVDCDQAR